MKFINFAVLKLAACFTLGIVVAYLFPLISYSLLNVSAVCLLLLLLIRQRERRKLQQGIFFGILTYFAFFTLGYANYQLRAPSHQKRHYSHFLAKNNSKVLQMKVKEVLKPSRFYTKYYAEILQLNSEKVTGKILLQIRQDSSSANYKVDDLLLVTARVEALPAVSNPYQFDYKQYLKNSGVHYQLRISERQIYKASQGPKTLKGFSEKIRGRILQKLSETAIESEQRSIIQALILGQRNDIDKELYGQYAAAGALHILAVSGLHVGILFLIFSWLLSPLQQLKFGKQYKSVLLVLSLWAFAVLAGLSPSVVRAVTMFSCFALAGLLNRTTHSFNTLFLSFFVLLVFNPMWLFHVGFQLSYLAVFFILWIQPKLYKLYIPRFYPDRLLWGIVTVTLSAQLGIAPLSLYYFHQFPGLFFITNLVILPFLGILLAGGLLVVLLAICNLLPTILAQGYDWLIKQLNTFIGWVADREAFLFDDISFSFPLLLACYTFIIAGILWCWQQSGKRFVFLLASITLWYGVVVWESKSNNKEQLVLFHRSGNTLLGYRNGRDLTLFQGDSLDHFDRFPVKSFRVGSGVTSFTSEKLPHIFSYKGGLILRLDSLGVYPSDLTLRKSEKAILVLLTHNPRVHPERLLDSLRPSRIIADGSNYRSYVKGWAAICRKRGLPFYYTGENGACIFDE